MSISVTLIFSCYFAIESYALRATQIFSFLFSPFFCAQSTNKEILPEGGGRRVDGGRVLIDSCEVGGIVGGRWGKTMVMSLCQKVYVGFSIYN
jgi:hypothetical protein